MASDPSSKLFELLRELAAAHIWFSLANTREGAVTILVVVPGERWEIDVFEDGEVDFEVFQSDGTIYDEAALRERLARYS